MHSNPSDTDSPEPADVQPEQLVWLDPGTIRFHDPGTGCPIALTMDGDRSYLNIFALRAFPRHMPDAFIQIFEGKKEGGRGAMLGMIQNPHSLSPDDRKILDEALRRSYLVPRVLAILDLDEQRYMSRWVVETDRGVKTFDMHQPHRNVIMTGSGRVILIDVEDNRYEVFDVEELDDASRRHLERVL